MIDWSLLLRLFIYDLLIAFAIAKLEINIEGKDGWAKALPTWRIKNQFTKLIWGEEPFTGYHLWFFLTMFLSVHFPFFIFPSLWNLNLELLVLGMFLIAVVFEDFFWFILNPFFGLVKFNRENVHWHDKWVGGIPVFYIRLLVPAFTLITLSFYI